MATIKVDNVTKRFRGEKGLCNIYGINLKPKDKRWRILLPRRAQQFRQEHLTASYSWPYSS